MRSLSLILVLASLAVLLERSEALRFITPRRSIALKSTDLGRMSSLLASTEVEAGPVEVDAEDSDTPEVNNEKGGKKKPLKLVNDKGGVKYKDDGTSYIMCSQCKSSYIYDEAIFGSSGKGKRVCCGVCGKEWFQSSSRVLTTDSANFLTGMTDNKVTEIRRAVEMRQWPRSPRLDRIGVFVGNLPYNYDETEIGDLFAEYGVTNISLVKDPEGLSKGFCFVEVAAQKDADKMIEEMHHFHTDSDRKLTVRIASQNNNRGGGRGGDRQGGRGGGRGGGGGGEGPRKVWTRR